MDYAPAMYSDMAPLELVPAAKNFFPPKKIPSSEGGEGTPEDQH